MANLGMIPFPGVGHWNPFVALASRLVACGHSVTIFHDATAKAAAALAGLEFCQLPALEVGPSNGAEINMTTEMFNVARRTLAAEPDFLRARKIDMIIVDQANLAGGTVAEHLNLPFITLATSPVMPLNDSIPPANYFWKPTACAFGKIRNRVGNLAVQLRLRPVIRLINAQRYQWGLKQLTTLSDTFSRTAILSNLPKELDFIHQRTRAPIHYPGPLINRCRRPIEFPWTLLDSSPLIFVSLGTVRNTDAALYKTILDASVRKDLQVVVSSGGSAVLNGFSGRGVIFRRFVPQMEVLARAVLFISHGGANSVIEAVATGVPMVVLPQTDDQPGMAARVEVAGVGKAIAPGQVSVPALRDTVEQVLCSLSVRERVQRLRTRLSGMDGPSAAAQLVTDALRGNQSHETYA